VEWNRVITHLEDQNKLNLLRIYQEAKLRSWDDNHVRVCFSKDSFNADSAVKDAHVAEMKQLLAERYGRTINFSVELLSPEAVAEMKSVVDRDAEQRSAERSQREQEARAHPLTKVVLETFGASIQEIKTDV